MLVISPLVYIFAAAGVVVVVFFAATASLTYEHAKTRSKKGGDLQDYIAGRLPPITLRETKPGFFEEVAESPIAKRHAQRERVMHLTVGDLVRDDALGVAATEGAASAAKPTGLPHFGRFPPPWEQEVEPEPHTMDVSATLATEAEARRWNEDTLRFLAQRESAAARPLRIEARIDPTEGMYRAVVTTWWENEREGRRWLEDFQRFMADRNRRTEPGESTDDEGR